MQRSASKVCAAICLGVIPLSIGCGGGASSAPEPVLDAGRARFREPRRAVGAPHAAGTVSSAAPPGARALLGTWYLRDRGARRILSVQWDEEGRSLRASLALDAQGENLVGEQVEVEPGPVNGEFILKNRGSSRDTQDWYRLSVAHGVLAGRVAPGASAEREPARTAFAGHVTGWNREALDAASEQRTWDLVLDGALRATLRIDRATEGVTAYAGTLKVYASIARGIADEGLERDIGVLRWDGENLEFFTQDGGARQLYRASVVGRHVEGRYVEEGSDVTRSFRGERRDVLGFGLAPRRAEERDAWSERARQQVARLMMAGNPAPERVEVTVLAAGLPPLPDARPDPSRDDDLGARPPTYHLSEMRITSTLPGEPGGLAIKRETRVLLAKPDGEPPAQGWPVAVVLNGHWGSARQAFDPSSSYWYGDAFARRGQLVIAVDVSHRPPEDRGGLYADITHGDAPGDGNGTHPSIRAEGMDSDWEEDGERAWDAMRALDVALAEPGADSSRVSLVGLSMGGEVASVAGAIDTRFTSVIPAGFSPDVAVYRYRRHPCWDWVHADVNEYLDVSDYHAMIAPRTLVVETGMRDTAYSIAPEPFAADKQVLRRSRAAYVDAPERVVHFLHPDAHSFQVGDLRVDGAPRTGVTAPLRIAPEALWSDEWQRDRELLPVAPTLFDLVERLAR